MKSRTEQWSGVGHMNWSESFASSDGSLSATVDQTYVATLSSTARVAGGTTSVDSWRRLVTDDDTYETELPYRVEGAMHKLWSTTTTDTLGRTISEIAKFGEGGAVIQEVDTVYNGDDDSSGYVRSAGGITLAAQSDDVTSGGQTTTTSKDVQGIPTTTVTDASTGELISQTRAGVTTSYATTTGTDGSSTQTVTQSAGGATRTVSVTVTDAQGRTQSVTDANGGVTSYSYANNGRTVTTTLPGGGTRITDNYLDGQLKSITGTAVTPEYHHYVVNAGSADYEAGSITETVYYGADNGSAWRKTTTNSLGQTLREESPSPAGGVSVTVHTYNTKGQRVMTSSPGMADLIMGYDDWGSISQQGYDMDTSGTLTAAAGSNDVLTTSSTDYVSGEGTVLETVVSTRYTHDATESTLQTKTERKLLEGGTWQRVTQADGTVITQSEAINPATATRTVTVQQSVTGTQLQTQVYVNGLLMSETLPGVTTAVGYEYNDFGQVTQVSHPLNGTVSSTYDDKGRLSMQGQSGGNTETYTYQTVGDPGLVQTVTNSDSNLTFITYSYDPQGRVLTQDGTAGYPLRYEYDVFGRLSKLHTYRSGTLGDVNAGDITTWNYDAASGVLLSKTDAASHSTSYTYDVAGRVHTRTWQRGVSATYGYDGAGRQKTIDYSDSTPGVSITYDGVGRRATVTDGAGTHTLAYDPASGGKLATWSVNGTGAWSGLSMGYGHTLGRRVSRTGSLGAITLPAVTLYGYDSASGRLKGVTANDFSVTYNYTPATGWYEGVSYTGGPASTRLPDDLMRLHSISWAVGATTVSGHGYTINGRSRRTDALRQDSSSWHYDYNDRGEVTGAKKKDAASVYEPGKQFGFEYDGIGNRTSSKVSSIADTSVLRTTGYTPNALNQYDSITHPSPGWLVLRGSMNTTTGNAVTINGNAPTLTSGPLWFYEENVVNSDPVKKVATVTASRADGGRSNGPITTMQKGVQFIPPASEAPVYDLDGNLTDDARWHYTWDGENRLIAVEEHPGIPVLPSGTSVKRQKLEFSYDALGRRMTKRLSTADSTGAFVLQKSLLFLYDGWNMIAEIDTTNSATLQKSYEWGMDLSGDLKSAGGVGGLLAVRFHGPATAANHLLKPGVHAPLYDGNGNVTELVSLADGSVSARYEYGAFGETISVDGGAVAAANPFRFSTKRLDVETGFYYYGYRYYDPVNGRWPNRDPIEEQGGTNLYCGLLNDGVNNWDYLGREVPSGPDWLGDQQRAADAMSKSNPISAARKRNPYWDYLTGAEKLDAINTDEVFMPSAKEPTPDKRRYSGKFGCCDAATIAAGKANILAQSKEISYSVFSFKRLYGQSYSCYNCNTMLWSQVKCAPCWFLYLENRRRTTPDWDLTKDHWVIVGFAVNKTGAVVDTLVLDKTGGMTDLPTFRKTFSLLWGNMSDNGGPRGCGTQ